MKTTLLNSIKIKAASLDDYIEQHQDIFNAIEFEPLKTVIKAYINESQPQ